MKKTISIALILSFAFIIVAQMPVLAEDETTAPTLLISANPLATTTATTTVRENKRIEKISSPEKIKLFEQIKKIGNDLFGVKKSETVKATSTKVISTKVISTKATSSLEKITSLDQVKFFEQIKKIGNDLFGVKKKNVYTFPTLNNEAIACVSTAIDTKDAAVSTALTVANTETTNAIAARGVCQKAALSATGEKVSAINACNKTFNSAHKTANDKFKAAQKTAWTAYNSSLKNCAANANTSEIKIEDGGQDINNNLN